MSKQNMMIAGAVIVIIIIALLGYFLMSNKSTSSTDSISADSKETNDSAVSKSSVNSLLGTGKNVTCKITYPDNGGSGSIYVSDKKFSGEFSFTSGGKTTQTSVINDGDYMYSWYGTTGMKFKASSTTAPSPASGTGGQSADLDKQVDMNCSAWTADNSKFVPPADVQFTDYTEMMQKTQTGASGAPKMDSSYCNQLTDPQAKAACVSAISGQ